MLCPGSSRTCTCTNTRVTPFHATHLESSEQIFCMVGHGGPEDPSYLTQSHTRVWHTLRRRLLCLESSEQTHWIKSFQRETRDQQQGQVWTEPETCSTGHRQAAVALIGCRAGMKAQYTTLTLASALRTIGAEGPQQQSRQELMMAIMAASNHKPLISNQVFTRWLIKA